MFSRVKNNRENWGIVLGYFLGYFFFTSVLFYILVLSQKLPKSWNFFHVILITFTITLAGIVIKRLLK